MLKTPARRHPREARGARRWLGRITSHRTAPRRIASQRSASHHGARMPGVPCSRAALPGEASPPCPRLDTGLATTVGDAESYTASSEHLSLRVPRKANSSLTLFDLGPSRAVCGGTIQAMWPAGSLVTRSPCLIVQRLADGCPQQRQYSVPLAEASTTMAAEEEVECRVEEAGRWRRCGRWLAR